jgi:hypothetical protein
MSLVTLGQSGMENMMLLWLLSENAFRFRLFALTPVLLLAKTHALTDSMEIQLQFGL